MRKARIISLVLVLVMLCSMSVYGAETTNWFDKAIENAVSNGLFNSKTAKSLANEDLTRAEMAAVINRAFGSTSKASLDNFTDVPKEAWYYDDMAKAVNMGTSKGSEGKLNPKGKITREEAFAVLARAIKLTSTDLAALGKFSDAGDISTWAKPEIAAMVKAGYVNGSDSKLKPKGFITRAEFAQIMDNMIKGYIKAAGTYTSVPSGNILINTPNVNLKGVTVSGDLIIGDGVGNGEVTLDSVKVIGRTVIRGGGVNSIKIIGASSMGTIVLARVDGPVRVVVSGGANVQVIEIADGSDDVLLEGTIGSIEVNATGITVTANNAQIGTVSIEAEGAKIAVGTGSTIDKVKLDAPRATADVAGTIKSIEATKAAENAGITTASTAKIDSIKIEAAGTTVTGTGTVTKVEANANDVKVDTLNTSVSAGAGTTGVTAGGKAVEAGNTATPPPAITPTPTTTGSSGGGSGSTGSSTVAVSAITVTGNATVINGQTLQLGVTVDPTNATNKTVTWSVVSGPGTIDANGLLSTAGVGTVTVKAVAKDGSLKEGTKDIAVTANYFTFNAGTIEGYDIAGGLDVVIPSKIDGVAVTGIGEKAFYDKGLTSVTIPNSVTTIGISAFYYDPLNPPATKLRIITMGTGVITIGARAFAGNDIVSVELPEGLTTIGDFAFIHNKLTSLTLPNSLMTIGVEAFDFNLPNLLTVTIGSGVEIGDQFLSFVDNQFRQAYKAAGGGAGTYTFSMSTYLWTKSGVNADQDAPTGLAGVAPTSYGLSDGKITGTTTLMEYKLSTGSTYTAATVTEITGLAAGTYNVRLAVKMGFNAGTDAVVVVVPVLSSAKIITATTVGTLTGGNITAVPAGTKVSALKAGLTVSAAATVEILAGTGGVAVTSQATTDVTATMVIEVTAENGTKAEYTIAMADVLAVGTAAATTQAYTITYTLSTGTFDATAGSLSANWTLGGKDVLDLVTISNVVLSAGNTVATITVGNQIGLVGQVYTVAPAPEAFAAGFTAPAAATVTITAADVWAEGTAAATEATSTIAYTLTTGTFDAVRGIVNGNWIIAGADATDLGVITGVVLNGAKTVATITVTNPIGANTKDYTVAPTQAAFAAGFTAPATATVTITAADVLAVGTAAATKATSIIAYSLTTGTFDAVTGIVNGNWTIAGANGAELGAITGVVLNGAKTVATITVTNPISAVGKDYTVAPAQAAFVAGFTAPAAATVTITAADVLAVGTAAATEATSTIAYTLTTGIFDAVTGIVNGNWTLEATDVVSLKSLNVVLSAGNTVATITVDSQIGAAGHFYTVAPAQAAFAAGFTAPAAATVKSTAAATAFTAATNNVTANDVVTLGLVGTTDASGTSGVATASISGGKIAITSVSAGSATITVTDAATHTATIAVTVAADGTITIGTITKHIFSVVNTRTGVDYTVIQTAINSATAGDIILVEAGSYTGALVISTNNLTLKSVNGRGTTIIDANSAKTGVSIIGTGVTVEGFKIINFGDGTNSYAIWVHADATNATIKNNYITTSTRDNVSHGIMVDSVGAQIIGNTIENLSYTVGGAQVSGYASTGIGLWDAQDVVVQNNIINNVEIGIGIYPAGYVIRTMSGIVISGNDIKNNTVVGLHFSPSGVILQGVVNATSNTFTSNAIQVEDANTGADIDLTTILGANTFSPTSIINGRSIKQQ